jgi:predicted transcriptional regulator
MKTKRFVVAIRPLHESLHEFAHTLEAARKGKRVISTNGVSFSDVETFRKFFSKKRMELLGVIKKESPRSVYQLAHLVGRGYKNVHDDVDFFKELGLVGSEKNSVNLKFSKLCIEVEV